MRGHCFDSILDHPPDRGVEDRLLVTVKAEHETRVYHDSARMKGVHQRLVTGRAVLSLVNIGNRLRTQALEPDEQAPAASITHQIKQIRHVGHVGGNRRAPLEAQRTHLLQQLPRERRIADEVVVDEHDMTCRF